MAIHVSALAAGATAAIVVISATLALRFRLAFRKAEKASREALEWLEHMADGFISVDARGLISYANRAAEELMGRGELLGKPFAEAAPGGCSLAGKQRIQLELGGAAGERLLHIDARPAAAGGFAVQVRDVTFRHPAERDPDGTVNQADGVLDPTERRNAEAALLRSNQELQQFAYSASHDLKEPLRMIRSYMQLLKSRYSGQLDKDADEYIEFAVNSSQRMQELVDSLLEYARAGDIREMPVQLVDANDAYRRAVESLRSRIKESGAEITCAPLPSLIVNEFHVEQLFQNLIGNAIKYRGEKPPKIDISVSGKTGVHVFAVHDNGIGIEARHFEKIFMVFERVHGRAYPGSGIGLATCHRIVARYGGKIWVESQPGIGSVFYFSLPAASKVTSHTAAGGA